MNKEFTIILKKALEEDIGKGDITSEAIVPARKSATAVIKAKQNGILCGIYFAQEVFKAVDDKKSEVDKQLKDKDSKISKKKK